MWWLALSLFFLALWLVTWGLDRLFPLPLKQVQPARVIVAGRRQERVERLTRIALRHCADAGSKSPGRRAARCAARLTGRRGCYSTETTSLPVLPP